MKNKWDAKRKNWYVLDIKSLTGQLGHISETSTLLGYLLSHLYTSIKYSLGIAKANLIHTQADFHQILEKER